MTKIVRNHAWLPFTDSRIILPFLSRASILMLPKQKKKEALKMLFF